MSELAARLLASRSIAVVGARESSTWTQNLVANLQLEGFAGEFHLVNPRQPEMLGRTCYPSLEEVPGEIDCAYVMVGTERAEPVLEACVRRGVRSAVLLTAGFKEVGQEGAVLERRLVDLSREAGIGILGPNCLGFIDYHRRLAAYGLPVAPPLIAGGVAFVSQSGAMLVHYHRMAQARGIGLACSVSIGNEAMLTAADFIDALVADPRVKVVSALIEGIRDADAFLAAAGRALAAGKPLVVFKIGGSEAAARSISAHTGSLAGADEVVSAVFRQRGVVRVRSLEQLLETSAVLASSGWPAGARTAAVTVSGGACGIVSDLAEQTVIELPDFAPETKAKLRAILPVFGAAQNPMDTTGVIVDQPQLLGDSLRAVAAEGSFDAYLINSDPPRDPGPNAAGVERRLELMAEAMRGLPFAVAVATGPTQLTEYGREALARYRLHFANGLTHGVRAVADAIEYGRMRGRYSPSPRLRRGTPPPSGGESRLLEAYGIGAPEQRLARDAAEAGAAAEAIGFPVVVKIQSAAITHKTEAGGVRLGLGSAAEAERAYREVVAAAERYAPGAEIEGVLVVRQVEPVVELIAGIKRDPLFGPVLVAGIGGIFVEVLRDVALRIPPIGEDEAEEMLAELRGYPLLRGARGRPAADVKAAARAIAALGDLALDLGDRLLALDLNPLFVLPEGEGVLAGDVLFELVKIAQ
ncbi:MAG TPA: acetate--CoA ligase family protein [Candidatus Dormibacteraeota bacterium]